MYSNLKSIQILVSMLKKKGINSIVISPGNSHNAIVRSIEEDGSFKTYNVVDERSAAFFAIGLIQELNKPVAICCTAGTAATNYMSGVTEAFRRDLPLFVITADKNPYYLNQLEDQMIDQVNLFRTNTRYSNTLPIVRNAQDEKYCERIINEAFLELNHHGKGPVHINVPIEEGMMAIGSDFTTVELPKVNLINRIDYKTNEKEIQDKFGELKGKKVLIIYGQDNNITEKKKELIKEISEKYNCVFATDKLSNIHCEGTIELTRSTRRLIANNNIENYFPDVLINIEGNSTLDIKFQLKGRNSSLEQTWIVSENGKVADRYSKLSTIFETSTEEFLEMMAKYGEKCENKYFQAWKKESDDFKIPEFDFSNLYCVEKLMKNIQPNSNLNLANSTTIRIAQYFDLDNSVKVFCNRGVNGIDGCMSTFIGQAAISSQLNYLIVGDLTFFYDMNAIWNRYVGKNVRIMLNNNSGASLFHFNQGLSNFPTLNENVAAEHNAIAKGWVESRGFKYLSATNKEEFDNSLIEFTKKEVNQPVLLEVFTKKEDDAKIQHEFYDYNKRGKEKAKKEMKNMIKSIIGRK